MAQNQARLPNAYQEVEYLENTGDGNVVCNNISGIGKEFDFEFAGYRSAQVTSEQTYFASRSGILQSQFHFYVAYTKNTNNMLFLYSGASPSATITDPIVYGRKITVAGNVRTSGTTATLTVTDGTTTLTGTKSTTNADVSPTEIILFSTTESTGTSELVGKIYYFKLFSKSRTLLHYYIPCVRRSDNKPGMYDLSTNQFFAGNGTINGGPNV